MATSTGAMSLASGLRGRDRESFDQALIHLEALQRAAFRLTRNAQDAEDLVQETYLRAFRFFGQFTPGTNLRAWLMKILANGHLDLRRSRASVPRLVSLDGEEEQSVAPIQRLADAQRSVEDQVITCLELAELRSAIDELPPQFGQAVLLADLEDRPYDDVANLTGVGTNTVGSRVYRGRTLLRRKLTARGADASP